MYTFSPETRKVFYKQMIVEIDNTLHDPQVIRNGFIGTGLCKLTNSSDSLQIILKDEGKLSDYSTKASPLYYDAYPDRFESFSELWNQFSDEFKTSHATYIDYTDISGWERRRRLVLNALKQLS